MRIRSEIRSDIIVSFGGFECGVVSLGVGRGVALLEKT